MNTERFSLKILSFGELSGWSPNCAAPLWPAFQKSARAILGLEPSLRAARAPDTAMLQWLKLATQVDAERAEAFLRETTIPYSVEQEGFVTGYYQPHVQGSPIRAEGFTTPVLARPDDLINLQGRAHALGPEIQAGRLAATGQIEPYPTRAEIEAGVLGDQSRPLLWLADAVELFLAQVQGSARVMLCDGLRIDLIYDGRNGRPYSSIGRILIESGAISANEMSLEALKSWLRAHPEEGVEIMRRNESYVFFRAAPVDDPGSGPIGGQNLPLTAGVSLAIDRDIWPYGGLFWISADIAPLAMSMNQGRLWLAQDTGSAILGPARGDLYVGSGDQAGKIAGDIRAPAGFVALLPKNASPCVLDTATVA